MKVSWTEYVDVWPKVKAAARTTISKIGSGAYPNDSWKKTILLCEHSPIRKIKFSWKWEDLMSWVSVHFVRHWLGILHWVSTQRTDRTGVDRNELPQNAFVMHGRRENGYHDVKMIMQTVNIYDTLDFVKLQESKIVVKTETKELPTDENNLIYRAAKLLFDKCGVNEGVEITLTKRIPIAAGMAGGSTDAAAALVGINQLFELGLTMDGLKEIGVKIGADVPYCIEGGTALSEGIGEILTKLPDAPDCFVVVAKPEPEPH